MPLVGLSFGARALTWPQAKQESEAGSFPFPVPLIRAMEDRRADAVPTASVLAGCLRQFQLKRRVDYYEKPADLLPSIFGTAFHEYMQLYTETDPGQQYFADGVDGPAQEYAKPGPRHSELALLARVDLGLPGYEAVEVRGRCDYLHEGVLVRDWKSKVYVPQAFEPPIAHTRQVNVYNWLGAESGFQPAPMWELVYVSQSWLSRFTGPTARLEKVGTWVKERLHEWALYESQGELVPPLEELFADPDPRTKRLPAPCGYCPVRNACLAAWREGEEAPF
jgi:hypothetical protein